jgi:hypothetical protein
MTLKQEIETTIAAYQEACKLKNLNIEYCFEYNLSFGICYFTDKQKLYKLHDMFKEDTFTDAWYLCITPNRLVEQLKDDKVFFLKITLKIYLYQIHQIRLKYLQNLLKTLPNDRTN